MIPSKSAMPSNCCWTNPTTSATAPLAACIHKPSHVNQIPSLGPRAGTTLCAMPCPRTQEGCSPHDPKGVCALSMAA